jgi:hypothetical protein
VLILNGGLANFLKSGEKEAIVPIVDENDCKNCPSFTEEAIY